MERVLNTMSKPIRMRLTMDVCYRPNGVTEEYLRGQLEHMANYAAGEGLLSGDSDAVVEGWSARAGTVTSFRRRGKKRRSTKLPVGTEVHVDGMANQHPFERIVDTGIVLDNDNGYLVQLKQHRENLRFFRRDLTLCP